MGTRSAVRELVTGEVVLTVIGLVAGIVVGVAFSRIASNPAPGVSGLVGAVVFLVTQMLGLRVRVDAGAKQNQDTLAALAATLAVQDADRVLLEIALAHAGRDLSDTATTAVWRQLTWYTQREYLATNFLEPRSFYDTGQAHKIIQLQKTKLKAQPSFTTLQKVLIWKDAAERDSPEARNVVNEHLNDPDATLTLKGILREKIDQNPLLSRPLHTELSDQIDFGIFDNKVVLVWVLDAARKPVGGKVIVGEAPVAAFRAFFVALVQESQALVHTP